MAAASRLAQKNVNLLIEAGLEANDLLGMQEAIKRLRDYERLGSVAELAVSVTRSDILGEYIEHLPPVIQQAWVDMLTERKAL